MQVLRMWRHIPGVRKPEGGGDCSSGATKRKSDKEHEDKSAKRSRTFKECWLKEFPWLEYDEEEGAMHCRSCKNFGGEPLGKGPGSSTNFKHYTLARHQGREKHKWAFQKEEAKRKSQSKGDVTLSQPSEAERALMRLKSEEVNKLKILFRNALYIAKDALPFTQFERQAQQATKWSGCRENLHNR